ncbi:MAG: Stp1/IreP family PP2C-type Ser/Thr phosphatase [Pyrinomonadaceae bacterium]
MKDDSTNTRITSAAISDRGLSEKRSLNEDSFLEDAVRSIFVVADGVGGAQAGEVASQTAVEVLNEAFQHQEGGDIEDLLEIAIQRANSSIHQMAREHPKLSTMATTVVALHLNGHIATIGHVGDSRLYRLTPAGELRRETDDHSVVEEEVRAGRMTPDQAANHPSRNVISRALGAEAAVDVDTKTIEIEDGTLFLLCSDGITRHIPDQEIRQLLAGSKALDAVCEEMKRICYERGAEDNLTAVIVRIGDFKAVEATTTSDDEATIAVPRAAKLAEATPIAAARPLSDESGNETATTQMINRDLNSPVTGANSQATGTKAPSRQVISLESPANESATREETPAMKHPARRSFLGTLVLLLVVAGAAAAASFYGGMAYQQRADQQKAAEASNAAAAVPTPESAEAKYEKQRREVDRAPQMEVNRMMSESSGTPLNAPDPEFLYLYGRALMLSGKHAEASEAFKKSIERLSERTPAGRDPLNIEARISAAAAALGSRNPAAQALAAKDLDEVIQTQNAVGTAAVNTPVR